MGLGSGNWDPRSWIWKKPIPDPGPGVKKAPDPGPGVKKALDPGSGSATLGVVAKVVE
jgi:hypothetical protein